MGFKNMNKDEMVAKTEPESKFTKYIRKKIEGSDKSQRELSDLVGYKNPNMIAMLKVGRVKLALDRVPAMARALKVDPMDLFKMALTQFHDPDTCKELLSIIETGVSKEEAEVLEIARSASGGTLSLNEEKREALAKVFS